MSYYFLPIGAKTINVLYSEICAKHSVREAPKVVLVEVFQITLNRRRRVFPESTSY